MTGVPIVGTLVGGTGEVLGDDDAWPVGEYEGAESYIARSARCSRTPSTHAGGPARCESGCCANAPRRRSRTTRHDLLLLPATEARRTR